jgi:hypothetical protein
MREPQQQTRQDEEATLVVGGEETTLVAPRFDTKETSVARPVVPLDADAPAAPAQAPTQDYRSAYAPRRTSMLALALVSVLVGGVLGGAGLYIYQRQSQDPAVNPAATTTRQQTADAPTPPAATTTESRAAAPAQPSDAQATDAPKAEEAAPPARDGEEPAAAPVREPENVPAAERRTAPAEGAPKRGKKGDRDEEIDRHTAPPPSDGNLARAAEPEARRVDSIFYRPRRAERRARRGDDVDRLRRIFEGTPQ